MVLVTHALVFALGVLFGPAIKNLIARLTKSSEN